MALVHKKRSANASRRVLFKLGAFGCTLLPCALAAWYIALLLTKKEPPAALRRAVQNAPRPAPPADVRRVCAALENACG